MSKILTKIKGFIIARKSSLALGATAVAGLALSAPAYADGALTTMVSGASAQFLATTGFDYSELVTKVGDWIKMFLGGGLGLVDSLIGWIIALIIFGIIISLVFKAMRFLHILR